MRLKKVFAGVLAAAMLVCAVAVPAFAAEKYHIDTGLCLIDITGHSGNHGIRSCGIHLCIGQFLNMVK